MSAMMSEHERKKVRETADYLRSLSPEVAASIAPRVTAGLSAAASAAITQAAQRRVRAANTAEREWIEHDTRQRVLADRRLLEEFRTRQRAQQVAAQRREQDLQTWLLWQQRLDDIRRLDDRQAAAHFRAMLSDDRTWPAAKEALRATMLATSSDAFFTIKRDAAIRNGAAPADVAAFDAVRDLLSSQVKDLIREAMLEARPAANRSQAVVAETPAEKAVTAREKIEGHLLEALAVGTAGLTEEQRAACERSIRASVAQHFADHGLYAGMLASAFQIETLVESLRGDVLNGLSDLLVRDDILSTDHYVAMVRSIESSIDSLSTVPAAEREMVGSGLDPSGCSAEAVFARAARSMYEVAVRSMKDPSASQADLDAARALAEISKQKPEMDLQPLAVGTVLSRLRERRSAALDRSADITAEETMRPR